MASWHRGNRNEISCLVDESFLLQVSLAMLYRLQTSGSCYLIPDSYRSNRRAANTSSAQQMAGLWNSYQNLHLTQRSGRLRYVSACFFLRRDRPADYVGVLRAYVLSLPNTVDSYCFFVLHAPQPRLKLTKFSCQTSLSVQLFGNVGTRAGRHYSLSCKIPLALH